jgi:ribulose-5-phosphate 4-epimerase/fuculose-1-phosphate aldolase
MGLYEERQISEDLATACRVLGAYDMTQGALGHISYRLPGQDAMLIKAKGPNENGLRYTQPGDIVKVDWNAEMIDGPVGLNPPSESFLHIGVYKARPDVMSVVHCHPEHAVIMTITDKKIYPIFGAFHGSSSLAREGVPTYPSSRTIATPEQGEELMKVMGNHNVALLRGHGIAAAGTSIEQSTINALNIEYLCRIFYKAYLVGDPQQLPEEDISGPRPELPEGMRRPRGSAGGVEGMMATWKNHVRVMEDRLGRSSVMQDRD